MLTSLTIEITIHIDHGWFRRLVDDMKMKGKESFCARFIFIFYVDPTNTPSYDVPHSINISYFCSHHFCNYFDAICRLNYTEKKGNVDCKSHSNNANHITMVSIAIKIVAYALFLHLFLSVFVPWLRSHLSWHESALVIRGWFWSRPSRHLQQRHQRHYVFHRKHVDEHTWSLKHPR